MDPSGYCSDTTVIVSDLEDHSAGRSEGDGTRSPQDGDDHTQIHSLVQCPRVDAHNHDSEHEENDEVFSDTSSWDYASDERTGGGERFLSSGDHVGDDLGWDDNDSQPSSDAGGDDRSVDDDDDDNEYPALDGSNRSELGEPRSSTEPYDFIRRFATLDEAMNARDMLDGYVYRWKHNNYPKKKKTTGSRSSVPVRTAQEAMAWNPNESLKRKGLEAVSVSYMCMSHFDCTHLMQITTINTDPPVYELAQKGRHGRVETNASRYGINHHYKQRVEDLVLQNYLPSAIHSMLLEECMKARGDLSLVPEVKQIQNVRTNRRRRLVYSVQNFNDILVWIDGHLCTTAEEFYGPDGHLPEEAVHALIVLDWFNDHDTLGFVFTSRALFRNVKIAVESQPGELVCSADGTYKIHFGGWVLVTCGTSQHLKRMEKATTDNNIRNAQKPPDTIHTHTHSTAASGSLVKARRRMDTASLPRSHMPRKHPLHASEQPDGRSVPTNRTHARSCTAFWFLARFTVRILKHATIRENDANTRRVSGPDDGLPVVVSRSNCVGGCIFTRDN